MTQAVAPRSHFLLRWHRRTLGICLALFALEIGVVLVLLPWLRNWDVNSIPVRARFLAPFWMNGYFRGTLTGLGLLTVYVGIAELVRHAREMLRRNIVE